MNIAHNLVKILKNRANKLNGFKKDNLWLKSLMSWGLEGKEPMKTTRMVPRYNWKRTA